MAFRLPMPNLEEVEREAKRLLCPYQTEATPWEVDIQNAWFERVPVLALRWSQDDIDSRMIFRNDKRKRRSLYETLDELIRGTTKPEDIMLEVVRWDGELYSLNNRRLTDLLWYQQLRRSTVVYVRCVIREGELCPPNRQRYFSTQSHGLDINPNPLFEESQAQHCGEPLFNPTKKILSRVKRLLEKHPDKKFRNCKVHLRPRDDDDDGVDCDTLTMSSLCSAGATVSESREPRLGSAAQPVSCQGHDEGDCAERAVNCQAADGRQQNFRIFTHEDIAAFHKDLIDSLNTQCGDGFVENDVKVKEIVGGLQIRIPEIGNINIFEGSKKVVPQGKRVEILHSLIEPVTAPPGLAKVRAYPKK